MSFRLGCLPGKIPAGLHDLTYYAAGSLPKAPAKVPIPTVASWGMDMNDTLGDCGVAGLNHGFMADASIVGVESESFPSDQQISEYYFTYTGGQDDGVVLSDYLAYVKAHPFYGHTIAAYAPVAVHDIPTLQFATNFYGFSYTGITVTESMMNKVQSPPPWQPWTLEDALDPNVEGGHCVPIVAYDSNYLTVITWGQPLQVQYSAWHYMSTEAYAIITGEFAAKGGDTRGVNLAALQADLDKLSV
jgi:hypothetical protein